MRKRSRRAAHPAKDLHTKRRRITNFFHASRLVRKPDPDAHKEEEEEDEADGDSAEAIALAHAALRARTSKRARALQLLEMDVLGGVASQAVVDRSTSGLWCDRFQPRTWNDMIFSPAAREPVLALLGAAKQGLQRNLPTAGFGRSCPALPIVIALVGRPGVGKTVLLRHLQERLRRERGFEHTRCVFMNTAVDNIQAVLGRTHKMRASLNSLYHVDAKAARVEGTATREPPQRCVYIMEDLDALSDSEWGTFKAAIVCNSLRSFGGPLIVSACTPLSQRFSALFTAANTATMTLPSPTPAQVVGILRRLPPLESQTKEQLGALVESVAGDFDASVGLDVRQVLLHVQLVQGRQGNSSMWAKRVRDLHTFVHVDQLLASSTSHMARKAAATHLQGRGLLVRTLRGGMDAVALDLTAWEDASALALFDRAVPPEVMAEFAATFGDVHFTARRRGQRARMALRVDACQTSTAAATATALMKRAIQRLNVARRKNGWLPVAPTELLSERLFAQVGLQAMWDALLRAQRTPRDVWSTWNHME